MGLIRLLLACGVVLCHTSSIYGFLPLSGDLAVQCFYIISGFYMALILDDKYVGRKGIQTFYINRALKIYPVYWTVLLLTLAWSSFVFVMGYPGVLSKYANHWPLSWATLTYLVTANIGLLGLDWIFFFGLNAAGNLYFVPDFNQVDPQLYTFAFNSIAWTVGMELTFYLLAPFLMRRSTGIIVALLLASLGLRIALAWAGYEKAPWNYMFFPTQLMFFMAGLLSFRWYKQNRTKPLNTRFALGLYVPYLLFLLFYYELGPQTYWKEVLLFLYTALVIPSAFSYFKKSKIDRYLGDLSYPVYIVQSLVISITGANAFPKIFGWGFTALAICIFAAVLAHRYITLPLEQIRQKQLLRLKTATVPAKPETIPVPAAV